MADQAPEMHSNTSFSDEEKGEVEEVSRIW